MRASARTVPRRAGRARLAAAVNLLGAQQPEVQRPAGDGHDFGHHAAGGIEGRNGGKRWRELYRAAPAASSAGNRPWLDRWRRGDRIG